MARAAESSGDRLLSGFGRIILAVALLSGAGIVPARSQAVLGDPRDSARIFAANCSSCHKSPQGLAKSGQVAGFLRQHYTTGPEMSASMAAYLVAAGSAPASKKGAAAPATADATAAKGKHKKGEQLAAQPPAAENADAIQQRTLRGKQRQAKAHEEAAPTHPAAAPEPPAEETKQTAALSAPHTAAPAPQAPAPAAEQPILLDLPLPELPAGPPSDLVQSFFSSSPLP